MRTEVGARSTVTALKILFLTAEWMNKLRSLGTAEQYSATKRNESQTEPQQAWAHSTSLSQRHQANRQTGHDSIYRTQLEQADSRDRKRTRGTRAGWGAAVSVWEDQRVLEGDISDDCATL